MFLQKISQDIIKAHGNNLTRIAVIFPNKRASLWMNDYLLEATEGKAVFAPHYFSISDFFQHNSRYALADHIQLVSLLHKSYCKITGENETLDKFYAWGEILLADFDNVDKSLADAKQLFRNISNLHEQDSVDYLEDYQKELLERFFLSFTRNHESQIQQKFLALWNNLLAIYEDFKEQLSAMEIAYEGMLYRDVVENASYEDYSLDAYYFIGFNQLLECEKKLISILADKCIIRKDEASVSTVNPDAKITIAQTLTDDLQTRYIDEWLKDNKRIEAGRKTAIVLCDEHLLPSALYCLPKEAAPVNITTGFPLTESQPASYIATLLELYTEGLSRDGSHFRRSYLHNLQGHPLYKFAEPVNEYSILELKTDIILENIEKAIIAIAAKSNNREIEESSNQQVEQSSNSQLLSEAIFRVYTIITRLKSLHEQGFLDIQPLTLARLFKQIVLSATIPFHGEPAKGVQVMGVLETRNLDFDHILMLSCNEGTMPQGSSDVSVIPYNVKKAFSLATTDDRTNIFAYYFYRLLKRCKDVTLVYNASSNDTSPGEMSRFLLNLIVNNPTQVTRLSLQTNFLAKTHLPKPVEVTDKELSDFVKSRCKYGISPSAINTFFRCEKLFYYQYYRRLREEREEDETLDGIALGIFFHSTAEEFYKKFLGETITTDILQEYINKPALLDPFINLGLQKTQEKLFGDDAAIDSGGMEHLLKSIVRKFMKKTLINDSKFCPFTIVSLEQKYCKDYCVETPLGKVSVSVGGDVDRLDMINDGEKRLRVVDYKTGLDHLEKVKMSSVEDMFNKNKEGSGYFRQACIYSIALSESSSANPQHLPVAPALYYIINKSVGSKDEVYDPVLQLNGVPLKSIETIKTDFEQHLNKVLHEILNKKTFAVAENPFVCTNCPMAELCME